MPQLAPDAFQIVQQAFSIMITVFGPIFVTALVAGLAFRLGMDLARRK